MIGRRRLVVVILSPASVVDKPGDPALRVVPYGYGLVYVVSALVAVRKFGWAVPERLGVEPWKVFGFIAASFNGDCLRTLHEHGASMCFSEHGWTLLMSWRLWLQPVSRVVDVLQGAYILPWRNHLAWKTEEGPRLEDRDPGPRGRNPDPGDRDLEDGSWRNNMTFFIRLYKFHRSITLPCRSFSDALALGAGVGRKFDGEARNISIKGLSGSTNRVEECMGQYPGILRGRILARLRIRRTKRLNKIRRPKLRILMLDSIGLDGTFSMFILVPGDNLVDSWYRSRSPGHVVCVSSILQSAPRRFEDVIGGSMDFHPGTRRLDGLYSRNSLLAWNLVQEPLGRIFGPVSSFASSSYLLGSLKDGTRCVRLLNLEYRDASHSTFRR
ncbi:hypothetical protein YC2023_017988 [Brassica napus]